ncbi:hypothetical protein HO173_011665 [Letharia columbiana]|uniref:Uncharacterized protein n=1 Tax=Letharia columbiana TaxID=112416 RepID=A0A8H6FHJ3_9LECA|nr:uncharacterized protein HO173_011665 [Letharia columbiana]KAF6228817.1 hypothetical protein HO173_011665 [Letharia columbiana]
MHILPLLTFFALTISSTALPPLLLPSNPPSANPLPLNATTLSREPWPDVPWTYVIDESVSISIEHYGRHVCAGEMYCEERVRVAMNEIVRIVNAEYIAGRGKVNSFTSDGVNFWIRQETMVPKMLVEELVATLRWVTLRHGTTEVSHAGLLDRGKLAATFELTFPGIED